MSPAHPIQAGSRVHRLRRHQFLTLKRPRGLCLRAERGTLWVTVDGWPDDIELNAGQSRVFDGRATVVVGALGGDAVLSTTPTRSPGGRPWLRRWLSAWSAAPAPGAAEDSPVKA